MSTAATRQITDFSSILVASSNALFRQRVLNRLRQQLPPESAAQEAEGGADALAQLEVRCCSVVLLDTRLSDLDAFEILPMMRAQDPSMEVLLLDSEAEAPVCPGQTSTTPVLRRICEIFEQDLGAMTSAAPASAAASIAPVRIPMASAVSATGSAVAPTLAPPVPLAPRPAPVTTTPMPPAPATPLPNMIGESDAMSKVYRAIRLVARRPTTVLLTGESGTGKELVARAIHEVSPRSSGPFVVVNCAAIPESLIESELFGYSRGAFTGAVQSKIGRVHAAHGGTLFLDEVGELPLNLQAKLLRFLQEGEVQRLGSTDIIRIETRVVAATNVNLLKRVEQATFRRDLYYRLAVFPVELPNLSERQDDILDLAHHFLGIYCRSGNQPSKHFSPAAIEALVEYAWPGNVRELQHAIERATILADEERVIQPEHLGL